MNTILLSGNITKDVEFSIVGDDKKRATFSLAVNRMVSGEKKTMFVDMVAWGNIAQYIADNAVKGERVVVTGTLDISSYQDNSGNKRTKTQVIVSEINLITSSAGANKTNSAEKTQAKENAETVSETDDGIPF